MREVLQEVSESVYEVKIFCQFSCFNEQVHIAGAFTFTENVK